MRGFLIFICMLIGLNAFDLKSLQESLKADEIEGNFTQTKIIKNFPIPFKSSGTFKIVKSNELIWKNIKPINDTIKMDKNGLFTLDKNGSWIKSEQNMDKGVFLDFLSLNEDSLKRIFIPNLEGNESSWTLTLNPKNNILKEIFNFIKIKGDSFIRSFEIKEVRGDKSHIKFTNLKKKK